MKLQSGEFFEGSSAAIGQQGMHIVFSVSTVVNLAVLMLLIGFVVRCSSTAS